MIFRLRYKILGGHTHIRVFAGQGETSLGKCGDLVFRNEEWVEFIGQLTKTSIEFRHEDEGEGK